MNAYYILMSVAVTTVLAMAGTATGQDQPPKPTDAAAAPAQPLVELNRAIQAYLSGDQDAAEALFGQLLSTDPQGAYRAACHYYLGLIGLDRGLRFVDEAKRLAESGASNAWDRALAARAEFERAQAHFEQVVREADATVEMINAALLLGISQLASDYPGPDPLDKEAAFRLARRAEDTLQRYVSQTDAGRQDRNGHFYLAVARYRLADEYRKQAGRGREYGECLASARQNLERAATLAAADHAAGRLAADEHARFQTVLTYYHGLLAVVERDYPDARRQFGDVTRQAAGTDLAKNAQVIIDTLNEVETAAPLPIQLPVPRPIGPWEFEGRLRLGNWYDSNVILLGKETTLPRGFKRKDDYQYGVSADFNISRYIPRSEAPWIGESLTVGVGGGTSHVWQPNIPQFDVNRYAGRAYLNWQPLADLYLGLQYEGSYTQLGHDPFITSHRLTPVVSKIWRLDSTDPGGRELGRTDLYYSHDDRNYLDRITSFQLNRDGNYQAVGAQQTFNLVQAKDLPYMTDYFATHEKARRLFGSDWLKFYVGYEYRDEQTAGTEFDLRGHSVLWGFDVPLPYRLAFELDGEFAWGDYTGASVFDYERKERADFVQRYNFGLTYTLVARGENENMRTLAVKLRGGVEMTFQNSNIWNRLGEDIYEYDRAIYGVQLEVDF